MVDLNPVVALDDAPFVRNADRRGGRVLKLFIGFIRRHREPHGSGFYETWGGKTSDCDLKKQESESQLLA